MKQVSLSRAFLNDRACRELPIGQLVKIVGGKAHIIADDDLLTEMRSDAAYQGWFTDCSTSGVIRAARTAFRDLGRHNVPYRHGERVGLDGLTMPGDR